MAETIEHIFYILLKYECLGLTRKRVDSVLIMSTVLAFSFFLVKVRVLMIKDKRMHTKPESF